MSRYLTKRSLILSGHQTSVALEPEFWRVVEEIAREKSLPVARLVESVDVGRQETQPLASALRVMALRWCQEPRA